MQLLGTSRAVEADGNRQIYKLRGTPEPTGPALLVDTHPKARYLLIHTDLAAASTSWSATLPVPRTSLQDPGPLLTLGVQS